MSGDMVERAYEDANCACHYFHSEEHCPVHGVEFERRNRQANTQLLGWPGPNE